MYKEWGIQRIGGDRGALRYRPAGQPAREIGRQQAVSEAVTIAAEELRLATEARFAAAAAHDAHPDDDSGFLEEFKRP